MESTKLMSSQNFQIAMPQIIRFGAGVIGSLAAEVKSMGAKSVLIVTDPGVAKAGLTEPVKEQISKGGASADVFAKSEPEPTLPRLDAAVQELRIKKYDLLVGLGGGSSIDTVKGLSVLLAHGGRGQDYIGPNKIPGPGIPIVAIPTTAGTGSEVTQVAVFGDLQKEVKTGMFGPFLLARVALVDPSMTYGCPPSVTAASGIDALVHAIEAYTCNKANIFSDAVAVEAMKLISGNLRAAVRNGSDKDARSSMAEGALYGGMAFGNSGVGAVHAMAHLLGARFHVSHGVANGLLLSYIMESNFSANPAKFASVARLLGVKTEGLSAEEASSRGVAAARELAKDIGIPLRLRDVGVPRESLEKMAVDTMEATGMLASNARKLSLDDVRSIWQKAW
jgi:alcohol dehydrogenase